MALLDELHKGGATLCMVTHDARYAELAQRKIRLFDGRVVDEETYERLRHEDEQRLDALIGQRVEVGA
jgi:putative ABC transport system ATP-binding protein